MMTSSNGNIFRVTGHLCGEFTGPRWIPHTKASDAELLMFSLICVWINDWVNNREAGDSRRYRAHYDVIVMFLCQMQCSHVTEGMTRILVTDNLRTGFFYKNRRFERMLLSLLLCNAYIIVMHHTMITPTSIESKHEMFMASAPN